VRVLTRIALATVALAAVLVTTLPARRAHADGMPSGPPPALRKQAWLEGKTAALRSRLAPSARAAETAALRARIGAPPEVPISIRHQWTHEVLVIVPPSPLLAGGPRLPPPPGRRRPRNAPPPLPPAPAVGALPASVTRPFLRCRFTERRTDIDPRLLPVVIRAAMQFNSSYVEIVSGYRSPKYNLMLRKKGHEVADDSQHSHGHAVDFRVAGVPTATLRDWVKSLAMGGVGYYPDSAFVHADVGPVRFWKGK